MKYNQNNLNVCKVASKYNTRLELASVFFTDKKTVATDSIKLIEMSTPTGSPDLEGTMQGCAPFLVNAGLLTKMAKLDKGMEVGLTHIDDAQVTLTTGLQTMKLNREDAKFPEYQVIFDKLGTPKVEMQLSAEHLGAILDILKKLDNSQTVTLKMYGANEPLLIEAKNNEQSGRGMVMPLRS